jgi:hypothetical protein
MAIALPLAGGCLCGSLRYEIRGQPLMLVVCHCTTCQKRTGSACAMNLIALKPDFRREHGLVRAREMPTESGRINVQCFCEHCLVRKNTEPAISPDIIYVCPGTLD